MSVGGRRGRLTDHAYEHMREGILKGTIPVGTALGEQDLAGAMGCSRTPVRHALSQLLQEGLLEIGARRQLIVRGFSPEHREEILTLRLALESVAVRRASGLITGEEIDALRLNLFRQRRSAADGHEDEFIDLDEAFHLGLAAGGRLPLLEGFLRQLREFVRVARLGSRRPPEVLLQIVSEHESILDAIEAHESDAAHVALVAHLTRGAQYYLLHARDRTSEPLISP